MLERLDAIDWSAICHAYGPATDVPGQLHALTTGDKQQWERAIWELHGNIWHQHTVYEATSFAVPFLVELVKNQVPAQESILRLIALIAAGTSYLEVHRTLLQDWKPEQEQQLQRELEWARTAKRAVAAHAQFFFALMKSSNRQIRELCILILGVIEKESEITAADVVEAIYGVK